jgi:hypothetical protein
MANTLKQARQELKVLLASCGATVYEYVPARIAPPVAIIEPGSPYLQNGDVFTRLETRFNIVALVYGENDTATDDLDQLVMNIVDAVDPWDLHDVEQPAKYEYNGASYLGARISLSAEKDLVV